jgi:hypothetical protein
MKPKINGIITLALFFLPIFLTAKITKGPYLTLPETTSMTIMWECDTNNPVEFIYWQKDKTPKKQIVNSFDNHDSLFLYRVRLNGLNVDQKYYYSIIAYKDTSSSYFQTNPPKGKPFTFASIGDSRSNHDIFNAIADGVSKLSPRLIISMGDLVKKGENFDDWGPHFFNPAKNVIDHIPHISTLGDHETLTNYNGYSFYYYFRNGVNVDKMWFSYDVGDVHFISLDYRGVNNKEMIDWFKNDVKQSDAKWKIVYLHRPTYNLGGHRSNWGGEKWAQLYRENKIDVVFAGHSHIYERFYPMRPSTEKDAWPVTFITTGGAGAGLYDAVQNECAAVSKSVNHYNLISISGDTLKFKSYQLDGNFLDDFKIVKSNGKYSAEYLSLVKPQDVMDIYMKFANKLVLSFNSIPTTENPSRQTIKFYGDNLPANVPFKLMLSDKSSEHYRIEPLEGVLKKGETFSGTIVVYAKDKLKQKQGYFDPPLSFNVVYTYNGKKYTVYGAQVEILQNVN